MNSDDLYDFIKENCETRPAPFPEVRVCCPRCEDTRKYKLYINVNSQVWDCKICGYGEGERNIVSLLSDITNTSFEEIASKFGKIVPNDTNSFITTLETLLDDRPFRKSILDELEDIVTISDKGVINRKPIKLNGKVYNYLKSRGISPKEIREFNIKESSYVFNFVGSFAVFSMNDLYGRPAFQARRCDGLEPRYVSSKNINKCLYFVNKSNIELIKITKKVILVEGIFDVISCILNGFPALCTFGNKLTKEQRKWLKNNLDSDVEIIIGFDADLETRNRINSVAADLSNNFNNISIVDTSNNPTEFNSKVDFGDVLKDKSLTNWMHEVIDSRIKLDSSNYFKWLLETNIIKGEKLLNYP